MKNYECYTEEYAYTYNKIESYCYNMKNEMYNNWSDSSEWDSREVMETFISHRSYSLESIFGI